LAARERAFAHELSYGVTRLRGRLDHLIAPHVRRGIETVSPDVLELLRMGAYQILYLDGVPPYAAVSETVRQVRTVAGSRSGGFANAVLRRVAEAGDGLDRFPDSETEPQAFLSTWGSHPLWLIERWLERWSSADVRSLVERNNQRPDVYVVSLDSPPEIAAAQLVEAGVEAVTVGEGSRCVRLPTASGVALALDILGPSIVQDPAANLVSLFADVPSGTMVADLCAAPGGKLLALPASQLRILAADRSESRIHVLRENAQRVGRSVAFTVADALHPPLREADVVMLDVPCTGTGTLSRHPDARWRLSPTAISDMAALQASMLEAASDVVRPGGLLVYSTCTLEPEENSDRIEAFLSTHPEYAMESTAAVPSDYHDASGCLTVTPQATGFDGAFAARMRRDV
jgi:16S rRNA (cytosine967-C5)-methyltransferase